MFQDKTVFLNNFKLDCKFVQVPTEIALYKQVLNNITFHHTKLKYCQQLQSKYIFVIFIFIIVFKLYFVY